MPIPESSVIERGGGEDFALLPDDTYAVELLDIEEREETVYQSDEKELRYNFSFVIVEDGPHYGRRLWKSARKTVVGGSKPSTLYQVASALMGHNLKDEELDAFDAKAVNALIGRTCRVITGVSGTGKSNKVTGFLPKKVDTVPFDRSKVAVKAGTEAAAVEGVDDDEADDPFKS